MQFIGISGKNGSGKHTVARILMRILTEKGYRVSLFSLPISPDVISRVVNEMESAVFQSNIVPVKNWWDSLDYAIFDDVVTREDVESCRCNGVAIYVQGGKLSEHDDQDQVTQFKEADLFFGADYILTEQPSVNCIADAVKAMVAAAGYVKQG